MTKDEAITKFWADHRNGNIDTNILVADDGDTWVIQYNFIDDNRSYRMRYLKKPKGGN